MAQSSHRLLGIQSHSRRSGKFQLLSTGSSQVLPVIRLGQPTFMRPFAIQLFEKVHEVPSGLGGGLHSRGTFFVS
jgi:hypothetical protein